MKTLDRRISIKLSHELGTRLMRILDEHAKTNPTTSLREVTDEIMRPAIEAEERRLGIRG